MNILLFGATGNVGSRILTRALDAGHRVTAYVRRPEALTQHQGLTVVGGQLDDVEAMTGAARGADAVIIAVTGPMKDRTFMQRSLPSILEAVRAAGAGRVVLTSVFGAGDTAQKASWFARGIYRTALRGFLADKEAADRLLIDSGLEHTIVYPVDLKDAPVREEAAVEPLETVASVPGLPTLPFDAAAAALLRVAQDPDTAGRRLLITTRKGWKPARD
ncbi:NAD(P)-dependent oxidoreductase [Rothia kristinae]|uniref:NAD(P)-dependent oxidoreductase n=1 Tax=Rothia kristinae TaxID=37923 RepID=UPI0018CA9809|nr:SDR family oxidoreductase [Rothia kristinae]